MTTNNITIVSGYWKVKGKYSSHNFEKWLNNTIIINCPYVFFGNEETINIVKYIRKNLPTYYIKMEISDFYSYKFKNTVVRMEPHVPSTEVNLIWNEKINLVEKAKDINPFNSDFFMWVDAGIHQYRNKKPPETNFYLNKEKLSMLPKDKFIFSTSEHEFFEKNKVHYNHYYHYISGGCFILHKDIVKSFAKLYRIYMDKYLSMYNWINTEQKILTHIYDENPDLFHCFDIGYGSVIKIIE